KKTYTHFFTGVLTLLLGVVCVQSANAQYTITTTDGTQYPIFIGDPGQFDGEPVTATLELASSSCATMTNTAGSIVIADLDPGCTAAQTVDNAAAANVVAVIICGIENNTVNYDSDATGVTAGNAGDPTLAVFGMGADCADLKVNVGSAATLELLVPECNRMVPDNAIWGQNGEGEFDGGLGDWTVDNDNGWKYEPRGKLDRGAYNSNANQIMSPTLCNGAMVADASFGDNGGEPGNFLSGNCPSDANIFCETRLTSPVIDLTGSTFDGLFLQFYQSSRQFNSEYYLLVSKDGGATFSDTTQINQGLVTNDPATTGIISIPLLGVNSGDQLQFRLWYRGYYYFWGVDDFFLVEQQLSDMQLNTDGGNFFASHAANWETPASQPDIIPLLADIENIGNVVAEDVSLTATLLNEAGVTLDEASLDYGMVVPGFVDQNRLFDDVFQMPTEVGTYRLVYTLNFAGDENAANNSYTSNFKVGDNVFSKCEAADATARIAFPDQQYFSLGAGYHVVNGTTAAGTQLYIEKLRLGISGNADDAVSGSVNVSVYEWNDLNINADVDADDGVGIPERVKVYETSILVFGPDTGLEDYIIELGADRVALKDNQNYLVVMHGLPLAATDQYRFMAADSGANPDYNFAATAFAFGQGSVDGNLPDGSLGTITDNPLNMSRIGTIGGTGTADDNDTRRLFQVNNFAALCEMHISSLTGTEDINEDIAVSVFPNPASNNVFVDLALENVSDNVNLQVVDIQGRVVMTQNFANVKADKLQLNVANLNTGVYVINIRTEEGFTSARFIKD
ncbi:T9SS type A sorting domain-containing protein, partial [Saprospiraceae bacterium]|nr:T9SS type A sorting domain-containing protein [Saprospiraceae bacterium]